MRNQLVSYFTQDEIDYIEECLLEYSIRNYEKMTEGVKEELQTKYEHARNLSTQTIYLSDNELESFLLRTQQKYQENIEVNQDLIEVNKQIPSIILEKYMPKNLTSEEKIYYLLDFMTKYVNFSERYFNHCILTPPTKGIEFDFKNATPVSHDVSSVLVQGQGLSEDICNAMKMLGQKFGLPIETITVEYQNRLHAVNAIVVREDEVSLIDTARMVREGKIIDEYCLVDKDTLNKDEEYEFKEDMVKTLTIPKMNIRSEYNMINIIHEIKKFLPKTIYQKLNQKII